MRLSLAALLVLASFAAAAAEPSFADPAGVTVKDVSANAHLAAAIRLYQKLDLDAALAELQLAEADARDSQDERVQVLIYRGLIYSETGKLSEASDQFKRALAIRPWAEVPPDTSPRIAKNFSDARKSLWGMANVRPPQKRLAAPAAQPKVEPASATTPALLDPSVLDKK
jgi:tetratricopeptide (TPR) repeat protein